MATVQVFVCNAITGEKLLTKREMNCTNYMQNILVELGHRASLPVTLFRNNQKLECDFTPKTGDILKLSAVYNQGITNEEIDTLLDRIEKCHYSDMPDLFAGFSKAARDTKAVVHAAVKLYPECLEFASDLLRNDKDIVLEAVCQNGDTLVFASEELRNERSVVLEALLETAGYALEFASDEIRNDKCIVLSAVQLNGFNLQYASEALRNEKCVVIEAVRETATILQSPA